jgi:serine/threonine protein kinase
MGPGTPFFAAPEQLNNEKTLIDWRTDQFALGVTLALAYFGFHPYQADGEGPSESVAHVAARTSPSKKFLDAVAAAKLPAIARMVSAWPVERFRTPAILLEGWRKQ